jgi:hypothetical protein
MRRIEAPGVRYALLIAVEVLAGLPPVALARRAGSEAGSGSWDRRLCHAMLPR